MIEENTEFGIFMTDIDATTYDYSPSYAGLD